MPLGPIPHLLCSACGQHVGHKHRDHREHVCDPVDVLRYLKQENQRLREQAKANRLLAGFLMSSLVILGLGVLIGWLIKG